MNNTIKRIAGRGQLHTGNPAPAPTEYDKFNVLDFFTQEEIDAMRKDTPCDKRLFFVVSQIVLAHGGHAKGGQ